MEILKRGELPEEKTYTVTCHKCKSELRFLESEGYIERGTTKIAGDPIAPPYVRIQCPVCEDFVYKSIKAV